jgi:hypothetical protein
MTDAIPLCRPEQILEIQQSRYKRSALTADRVTNCNLIQMNRSKKQSSSGTHPVRSEHDPRITCYRWSNYSFRECHSKALAWFVQFAIRSDLAQSVGWVRRGNNFDAVIAGYPEIQAKIPQLVNLIRERHILDESALETIGLSLFHFPTLAPFFGAASTQAFVREASIQELRVELQKAYRAVAASPLEELFSDENGDFSLPALQAVWGNKLPLRSSAKPALPKIGFPASGCLLSTSLRQ